MKTGSNSTQSTELRRRRPPFRPIYLLVLLVMGLFTYAYLHKTQEIRSLASEEAALYAQNQQIARDNRRVAAFIRYAQTDPYIEENARTLGFTKPAEILVESQFVNPRTVAVRAAPARPPAPPAPSWKQWWQSFFG